MAIDDGTAVDYLAVPRGTPIYSSDEQVVGEVVEMLDNAREHIFDGIVFKAPSGERCFVDAPEVARTAERAVTLNIDAAAASSLGPPDKGSSLLSRLFGGGEKKQ